MRSGEGGQKMYDEKVLHMCSEAIGNKKAGVLIFLERNYFKIFHSIFLRTFGHG